MVDELTSILGMFNLELISQKFYLPPNSFELIRCHGDFRTDHFFDEVDMIMVYEE